MGDAIDDILTSAGLDEDAAAMGVTILAVYVLGFVNWELSLEVRRRGATKKKPARPSAALRNPARDAASSFEFGLQTILRGLVTPTSADTATRVRPGVTKSR
jgi:hypothetical protein